MKKIFAISLISLSFSIAFAQQDQNYKVKLCKELSSPYYDFAPTFIDDNFNAMILSSSRNDPKNKTEDPLFSIFYSTCKKGKWKKPRAFDTTSANSSNAVVAIDKKRKVIFETRCPRKRNEDTGCDIYYSFMSGDLMGEPLLLDMEKPKVDGPVTVGQPYFSNELDVLFFVAWDWPGGYGGDDIWYSKYDRANDTWGKPINMGPEINSDKGELYPCATPDGTFYFTSSAHGSLGGWDIFSAKKNKDLTWGKVENMGAPINSEADDFGITFRGNSNSGYFSSTREGGLGKDDIYEFFKVGNINMSDSSDAGDETVQSLATIFNKEECTADKESLKITDVKCYPNPNEGDFTFEFNCNTKTDLNIRIYSSMGQVVYRESISAPAGIFTKPFSIKNPNPGTYYIQILYNCETIKTEKIVIK